MDSGIIVVVLFFNVDFTRYGYGILTMRYMGDILGHILPR
jgi:hypothetical protein